MYRRCGTFCVDQLLLICVHNWPTVFGGHFAATAPAINSFRSDIPGSFCHGSTAQKVDGRIKVFVRFAIGHGCLIRFVCSNKRNVT